MWKHSTLCAVNSKNLNTKVIGYSAAKNADRIERENMLQYISPQDLKSFGLIPEIIGRLPVLTYLDPLDKKTLRNILTEPKNAVIKQYKKLFKIDGITLEFEEDALGYIVDKAIEYKLGARGLRSICENIMNDAMFDSPSEKIDNLYFTASAKCSCSGVPKSFLKTDRFATRLLIIISGFNSRIYWYKSSPEAMSHQ